MVHKRRLPGVACYSHHHFATFTAQKSGWVSFQQKTEREVQNWVKPDRKNLTLYFIFTTGYLGYTSGFSLLCMVFFLIVVSKCDFIFRIFCVFSSFIWNSYGFVLQVIYKKFQIPCPLTNDLINMTLNSTLAQLNTTATVYNEDSCKPKYFVFNSQVQIQKIPQGFCECIQCDFWSVIIILPLLFLDCVCCANSHLCVCVPPSHFAHVRGAQRVSLNLKVQLADRIHNEMTLNG